ncbi:Long-chain-fatty-acid--CoA ligase 5, partial [Araneus ventricosus]
MIFEVTILFAGFKSRLFFRCLTKEKEDLIQDAACVDSRQLESVRKESCLKLTKKKKPGTYVIWTEKNSGGARKSTLVPHRDTIQFLYEDTKTIWDVIQRGLRQSGNGPCVGWRDLTPDYSWITYSQFIRKAENFGSGLIKLGLKLGQSSKVGIYAQNSVEWLVAEYGCWSQSAIIVPLYDTMGPDACSFIINQAEIELVVCDEESKVQRLIGKRKETQKLKTIISVKSVSQELKHLAKEANINLHLFSDVEKLGELHPVQTLLPKPSDLSIICYTSGTTGEPKGAMVTHGNVVSAASVMKLVMTMAFLEGCSIGFFRGDFSLLEDDIRVLQPTFFPAVPRLLNKWCEKARTLYGSKLKIDLNGMNFKTKEELFSAHHILEPFKESLGGKVRMIITAAAPLSKNIFEFYTKCLGYEMLEIYGMTELAGAGCASLSSFDFKGNVGSPTPCCIIRLADVPEMNYFSKDSKGE